MYPPPPVMATVASTSNAVPSTISTRPISLNPVPVIVILSSSRRQSVTPLGLTDVIVGGMPTRKRLVVLFIERMDVRFESKRNTMKSVELLASE